MERPDEIARNQVLSGALRASVSLCACLLRVCRVRHGFAAVWVACRIRSKCGEDGIVASSVIDHSFLSDLPAISCSQSTPACRRASRFSSQVDRCCRRWPPIPAFNTTRIGVWWAAVVDLTWTQSLSECPRWPDTTLFPTWKLGGRKPCRLRKPEPMRGT